MSFSDILWIVLEVVIVIGSIMLHEIGHGYAAFRCGDETAAQAGRLTLNPIKHLDPFGSIILPLILAFAHMPLIGYAKPVPYNPNRFTTVSKKKGEVIVGLAGPCTNLILSLIFALFTWIVWLILKNGLIGGSIVYGTTLYGFVDGVLTFFYYGIYINLMLMFFNLIPIPPLDGSCLIAPFLNENGLRTYYKIESYAMPILLIALIILPQVLPVDPLSAYMNVTAGNLTDLLTSYMGA